MRRAPGSWVDGRSSREREGQVVLLQSFRGGEPLSLFAWCRSDQVVDADLGSQISGIHFQSYQLAYDLAKRAERCMQHESDLHTGRRRTSVFGYRDLLKKGLLAGDLLAHDLKRLDTAYLDRNVREYELTNRFVNSPSSAATPMTIVDPGAARFPYFAQGRQIIICNATYG